MRELKNERWLLLIAIWDGITLTERWEGDCSSKRKSWGRFCFKIQTALLRKIWNFEEGKRCVDGKTQNVWAGVWETLIFTERVV